MLPSLSPEMDSESEGVLYASGKVMVEQIITAFLLLLWRVEMFLLIAPHLFFCIGLLYVMSFVLTVSQYYLHSSF